MKFRYSDLKDIKKYLYRKFNIKTRYRLKILKNYDCITVMHEGESEIAWAAMNPIKRIIVLPIKNRRYPSWVLNIYTCFAHEIIHIWQYENDTSFDEDEADKMAINCINTLFGTNVEFVPCDTSENRRNIKEIE